MTIISDGNPSDNLRNYIQKSYLATPAHLPFIVAVSGGSLPKILGQAIASASIVFDWSRWYIFYADERLVNETHEDSNHLSCKTHFLDKVSIPEHQIFKVNQELLNNPKAAAQDYQDRILKVFGERPVEFDLVLLGLGPDGHTCSLFPGHSLLNEDKLLVSFLTDSPKPPSCRITFTFLLLNAAKACLFVATGIGKADMVKEILINTIDYPATRVKCQEVDWLLDEQAASKL
jgi:6-phosphogluconolactonase